MMIEIGDLKLMDRKYGKNTSTSRNALGRCKYKFTGPFYLRHYSLLAIIMPTAHAKSLILFRSVVL